MITTRYHFETIDSTNKKASLLAKEGAPHGTLVTADTQEAGVGRRGRSWSSQQGVGIYMSMVLRPDIEPNQASMLTLVAAMAAQKAMEEMTVSSTCERPKIKWPNDIVLNKKKVCGILTELSLKGTEIDFLVLGIGINVSNTSFPEELSQTASSLFQELGQEVDKEVLIAEVWKQFQVYYEKFFQTKDISLFQEEYEKALVNKEEMVRVLDPLGQYTGIAKGVSRTGELIVDVDGKECFVSSGEVSVRGIYGYV